MLLGLVLSLDVLSQNLSLADFKSVSSKIRSLKRYSYVAKITGQFPNGQKDVMTTTTYMDANKSSMAYKNEIEQVIVNQHWFYKVNHPEKYVSIFDIKKYQQKYPGPKGDISSLFNSTMSADFLDSAVIKVGKLTTAKRVGNISIFEFTFSKEVPLQTFILKFDNSTGLPQSIAMRTVNQDEYGRPMEISVYCDSYSNSFPESVFETNNLFNLNKGKVNLLKFKQYKVSTIQ